jgi:hypothetical protein
VRARLDYDHDRPDYSIMKPLQVYVGDAEFERAAMSFDRDFVTAGFRLWQPTGEA